MDSSWVFFRKVYALNKTALVSFSHAALLLRSPHTFTKETKAIARRSASRLEGQPHSTSIFILRYCLEQKIESDKKQPLICSVSSSIHIWTA